VIVVDGELCSRFNDDFDDYDLLIMMNSCMQNDDDTDDNRMY